MRLKVGTFASSGASFFKGIVNWLIGADGGKMFASENGTTFGEIQQTVFGSSDVNDVFYGVDLSIQGPPDTTNTGTAWTTVTSNFGASNILSIAYANGLWIAGGSSGSVRTSTNGSTWTTVTSNFTADINTIDYGNGLWIGGAYSGEIRTSTNGSTWTTVTSNITFSIRKMAYGINGWRGTYFSNSTFTPRLLISTNGSTWTTSDIPGTTSGEVPHVIGYANSLWIVSATSKLLTSTNGSTWTTVTSNFTQQVRGLAYGNGLWVAGAYAGEMRISTNGSTWTTVTSNFGSTNILSINYGNNLWIAGGGGGQIRTSTNGSTWTTVNSNFGTTTIRSIGYGNNLWVAGGVSGQMRTSPQLYTYPNNAFLAAANDGKLGYSTDGLTWTTRNIEGTNNYSSIAYGNSLYYAGGT